MLLYTHNEIFIVIVYLQRNFIVIYLQRNIYITISLFTFVNIYPNFQVVLTVQISLTLLSRLLSIPIGNYF